MRRITLCCLAGAAALMVGAAPLSALDANAPTWRPREMISSRAYYIYHDGADRALACNHYGNIAVAYYDANSAELRYAERVSGAGWVSCTVDTAATDTGLYPSLAFDRYERPAISYYDYTPNNVLKYAWHDGASWQTKVVDPNATVGFDTSLAFDLYGRPAIAYSDMSNNLRFAYDNDGDGNFTVSMVFPDGRRPTLAFDRQNRPRIAYRSQNNNNLYVATKWTGGWMMYVAGPAINGAPSLAINPVTGEPAVAAAYSGTLDLFYMEWNGYNWVSTTVDTGSTTNPSLAFDPADGRPAIAYDDNGQLQFTWFDGSIWHTQTVDANAGKNPSLAFNDYGDGWPVISYLDTGYPGHLYFVQDPPDVPEPASAALIVGSAAAGTLLRGRTARRRRT